jgi:O-antigen/teichoic acid export membrane protein
LIHFTRGLSASWLATLATVFYSLASVPIALRYLSVEEFGLFMLMLQIGGYFALVEMGMAGATARTLVDYKDRRTNGDYGAVILTGTLVFSVQALIIAVLGLIAAPMIVGLVGVPYQLNEPAVYLLRWLCVSFALATGFKIFASLLYANKRLDILNTITAVSVIIGLVLIAIVLSVGLGLKGLAIVFLAQTFLTTLANGLACWILHLFPPSGHWRGPSLTMFHELFRLAKDFFLVSVGNQVLEASQLIIVTRTMGLTAAAVWSVSTKIFSLLYQLLAKIQGTAVVFFSEMMVRGESIRLEGRFRQVYQLTAALAASSLAVAVAVNKPFVAAWADPQLAWPTSLSALLAIVVFLSAVTRCHVELIMHTKQIMALRYAYFLEAAAFVVLSLLLAPVIGFYGVVLSALACLILVRLWYSIWRVARYFGVGMRAVGWDWLRPSILTMLILIPFAWTAEMVAQTSASPWLQFLTAAVWTGIPALLAFAKLALPRDIATELQKAWQTQIYRRQT